MYKLQFINAYSHEILREEDHETKDSILEMIDTFEDIRDNHPKGNIKIFSNDRRTFDANFITYKTFRDEDSFIYRFLFNVKLAEVQAVIRD